MVGMRILVADDNVTMRMIIEKAINKVGKFQIEFAGNGNEALRFYRQSHHDLVIIDNYMPGKNGADVLLELRGDPFINQTHVIMITGDVSKTLINTIRTEELRIDDLIVKPIDFEKLGAKISAVAARVRRRNKSDGPLLRAADPVPEQDRTEITLTADVIDRGNIAIIELKGKLTNSNKAVISKCLKQLQEIFATTVVIDINAVDEIDEFGTGTLMVMNGWLALNNKDAFLGCDDCATKGRITSLGITRLIPNYDGAPDPFDSNPECLSI